jgi:hypothetical protein
MGGEERIRKLGTLTRYLAPVRRSGAQLSSSKHTFRIKQANGINVSTVLTTSSLALRCHFHPDSVCAARLIWG